ncbi:MAG: hypothetical protein NVS4B3_13070 [Gemmatimonadaceae bacterium]
MIMITSRGVLATVCLGLAACFHVGPQATDLAVARGPAGAAVDVRTETSAFAGELLALQDDGVILSTGSRLALVPYAAIRSLTVLEFGGDYALHGEVPSAELRARLAAVSRYPQGIDRTLRQRLVSLVGQSELDVAR